MRNDPFKIADQIMQTRQELLKHEVDGTFWSGAEVRQMTEALFWLALEVRCLAEKVRNSQLDVKMRNAHQGNIANDNDAKKNLIFKPRH